MALQKHLIIGTAGHVDHGKTSLIAALTGTNTDRLPEEKARGISIELGFASFDLPGDRHAAIVDVPGHERFVHHMVQGATGLDVVMLIIALDEGVMPQTKEHLDILSLLQVPKGLVVLTKRDMVDSDWAELVVDDVRQFLQGTFLQDAPMLMVSSRTQEGLETLKETLVRLWDEAEARRGEGLARLPIDRVFTVAGFGTVVTGTLYSGTIAVDDRLVLLPGDVEVRVRGVQVHGQSQEKAFGGQRVAVNLAGIKKEQVVRGQVLISSQGMTSTTELVVSLQALPLDTSIEHNQQVHFHSGTSECLARIVLLEEETLSPGEVGLARLVLAKPVAVLPKDRFVIRNISPVYTIGGGEILLTGVHPRRYRQEDLQDIKTLQANPQIWLQTRLQAGPVLLPLLRTIFGDTLDTILANEAMVMRGKNFVVTEKGLLGLAEHLKREVQHQMRRDPYAFGEEKEAIRRRHYAYMEPRLFSELVYLAIAGTNLVITEERLRFSDYTPPFTNKEEEAMAQFARRLKEDGLETKEPQNYILQHQGMHLEAMLRFGEMQGLWYRISEGYYLHQAQLQRVQELVTTYFTNKESMSLSEFRDLLDTSRKYAVPLLEYLDGQHITKRVGDVRIWGKK